MVMVKTKIVMIVTLVLIAIIIIKKQRKGI